MMRILKRLFFFVYLLLACTYAIAADFTIVNRLSKVSIVYDGTGAAIDSLTAHLLAEDIQRVTGYLPLVLKDIKKAKGNVIIVGSIQTGLVQNAAGKQSTFYKSLSGKWECYGLKIISKLSKNIDKALLIAGSDKRGTAYGVFTLSEKIGVSPWYWWADVNPRQQKELSVDIAEYISSPPSVKYRGIFINDEDWGLQPWAAKSFEPETGDIGPKTYAKVFELLLRLKANMIWPAMHPSTKAFYHYPRNKQVAADFSIIIGSSHAEPMLRNNVGEWNVKTMGAFNYITNKQNVYKYWEDRVKESRVNEAIYSMGMRGVHDSGIEGVKSTKEAIPLLEQIFLDQRDMLKKHLNEDITRVPQAFTAYKEVLDIYDAGLKVPDDVTLVWPDDNYGYIQRLNNEKEQGRQGGSGVYYHASYWGRPHDYLWLGSTHPALIREEMMKAYEMKADRLWVLNVGDIKPLEYNIQVFMDMAYNAEPFKNSGYVRSHLLGWAAKIFGKDKAERIQNILLRYYQLAFERRPEFMGWSQTEPTTPTKYTTYNHFDHRDEAQRRIDNYENLEKQVKNLRTQISSKDADAFYQLVYYPVVASSLINKKFLYRDKSYLYSKQNRLSASDYARLSTQAYDSIASETDFYNNRLAKGKWKFIMSMKPRDLPVYQPPGLPAFSIDTSAIWSIAPEGFVSKDSSAVISAEQLRLPQFNSYNDNKYFIDIFLNDDKVINWTTSTSANWITLSQSAGTLSPAPRENQSRIWVSINWNKAPAKGQLEGTITLRGDGKELPVHIVANNVRDNRFKNYRGFIESNGYVSIYATNFTRRTNLRGSRWEIVKDLGYTGNVIQALPFQISEVTGIAKPELLSRTASHLEYDFYTLTSSPAEVEVFTLPTHPVNKNHAMRYAVSIDDGPLHIADFKTVGRSEEWKQNVLSNSASRKFPMHFLQAGRHTLKIYMIDPGVILDRITINLGGLHKGYGALEEIKQKREEPG